MPPEFILDDPKTGSRVTFTWEHPEGFSSPLVRVRVEFADAFNVSARMVPPGRTFLRFVDNLRSLDIEGTFEERTFRDINQQLEMTSRPASPSERIIVCHVSLASDWDNQCWQVTVRLEIEVSRLPALVEQWHDFLAYKTIA